MFFLIFFCQFLPNFLFNPNSNEIFQTVRVPTVFQNERICQKMNFLFSFRTVSTPKFRPKTQKVCQKNLLCKHLLATSPNGFSLLRAVDEVFYFFSFRAAELHKNWHKNSNFQNSTNPGFVFTSKFVSLVSGAAKSSCLPV